jgi:hypothetical protein
MIDSEYNLDWPDPAYQACMRCPNVRLKDELRACIECGVVLCEDCTYHLGMSDYCNQCCRCIVCNNEAIFFCQSCSDLLCPDHVREYYILDMETGYKEREKRCQACL